MEQAFREHLQALPPAPRAELLHVLMLTDLEYAVHAVAQQSADAHKLMDVAAG